MEEIDKPVEYFECPGDEHNIENNTGTARQRNIKFLRDNLED
ncbi:MAG: hypothetical protein ACOC35_17115 [Promethearchaeia archaeon]